MEPLQPSSPPALTPLRRAVYHWLLTTGVGFVFSFSVAHYAHRGETGQMRVLWEAALFYAGMDTAVGFIAGLLGLWVTAYLFRLADTQELQPLKAKATVLGGIALAYAVLEVGGFWIWDRKGIASSSLLIWGCASLVAAMLVMRLRPQLTM